MERQKLPCWKCFLQCTVPAISIIQQVSCPFQYPQLSVFMYSWEHLLIRRLLPSIKWILFPSINYCKKKKFYWTRAFGKRIIFVVDVANLANQKEFLHFFSFNVYKIIHYLCLLIFCVYLICKGKWIFTRYSRNRVRTACTDVLQVSNRQKT